MSALAVRQDQTAWTPMQQAALVQLGVDDAPHGDLMLFLSYAQRTGLDPFSRQLYMLRRWDKRRGRRVWTIQSSIDGLRIVAQRSKEYEGQTEPELCGVDGVWRSPWLSDQPPVAARVGVWRKGFREPLYGTALLREYKQATPIWSEKPAIMLAKCAEALALRKAFPHDLSGIYVAEEMGQDGPPPPLPDDSPALAPPDPNQITTEQFDALWMRLRQLDMDDPDIAKPWMEGLLDRPVESSKTLTTVEAATLLDELAVLIGRPAERSSSSGDDAWTVDTQTGEIVDAEVVADTEASS